MKPADANKRYERVRFALARVKASLRLQTGVWLTLLSGKHQLTQTSRYHLINFWIRYHGDDLISVPLLGKNRAHICVICKHYLKHMEPTYM